MSDSHDSRQFYNTIARYYDAENEFMTADLELYNTLADDVGDPILDIGCGTGRVTFSLAIGGHRVTGLDTSKEMLARGQRRLDHRTDLRDLVTFIEGNALDYRLPEKYKLILLAYNALMHFSEISDQHRLLKHLAAALDEGGLLVIDLPNAGETFATLDDGAVTLERSFIEPESGHLVMQQSVSALNRTDQLQAITWIYDEIGENRVLQRTVAPLQLRYVFPAELDLLLQINGLRRVERYGDYDQSPFEEGCPRLIALCEKIAP